MKVDDPQCFVSSALRSGGGLSAWSWTERARVNTTYDPFFSLTLLVLILCVIHAFLDGRVVAIVAIGSETWTLDTTNDVHSPRVEVLLILN